MPCLTSCCCGFSVKAGTRAIAILSVVYSVFGLLMVGTFNLEKDRLLEKQFNIHQHWPSQPPRFDGPQPRDWSGLNRRDDDDDEDEEDDENDLTLLHEEPIPIWKDYSLTNDDLKDYEKKRRLELIMSAYAISVSINFLVSLSLLAGVKLERRWLLLPWVAWTSLTLIVSQMMVFYAPHHNRKMTAIPDVFSTGITIYCIMCVYSYFQILSDSGPSGSRHLTQSTWTGTAQVPGVATYIPSLAPRSALTVTLPPDSPPGYQEPDTTDNPPTYDPPPPYPGSPQDKKMFDGEAAAEGDTTTGDKQETTVDDVDERQRDLNKNNP